MSAENIRISNTTKELPSNIEAEQIILGSILVNNEIFDEISTIVNENIFFDPIHQKIFHYYLSMQLSLNFSAFLSGSNSQLVFKPLYRILIFYTYLKNSSFFFL